MKTKCKPTGHVSLQVKSFIEFDLANPDHTRLLKTIEKYPYISLMQTDTGFVVDAQDWVKQFIEVLFSLAKIDLMEKEELSEINPKERRTIKDISIYIDEKNVPTIIVECIHTSKKGSTLLRTFNDLEEVYVISPFEIFKMLDETTLPADLKKLVTNGSDNDTIEGLFISNPNLTRMWLNQMYLHNGDYFRRDCLVYYSNQLEEKGKASNSFVEYILSYADETPANKEKSTADTTDTSIPII